MNENILFGVSFRINSKQCISGLSPSCLKVYWWHWLEWHKHGLVFCVCVLSFSYLLPLFLLCFFPAFFRCLYLFAFILLVEKWDGEHTVGARNLIEICPIQELHTHKLLCRILLRRLFLLVYFIIWSCFFLLFLFFGHEGDQCPFHLVFTLLPRLR